MNRPDRPVESGYSTGRIDQIEASNRPTQSVESVHTKHRFYQPIRRKEKTKPNRWNKDVSTCRSLHTNEKGYT
ncbi:hypothetical protein EVA_14330 [gut metagenome]|uniref:Uncharacterized protein n=1 Tax=gut metagenome TaxID=749906 RepID=J9CCC0_9ZZZZ